MVERNGRKRESGANCNIYIRIVYPSARIVTFISGM